MDDEGKDSKLNQEDSSDDADAIFEELDEDDADNASSFADYNEQTRTGSYGFFPEGLANAIAEVARECLHELNKTVKALEAELVKRLEEASLCIKKVVAVFSGKKNAHIASVLDTKKPHEDISR
jgi:hypothetical protein